MNDCPTSKSSTNVKLAYLSNSWIPSREANSIHVMKMCQAFARSGHEVTLVAPDVQTRSRGGCLRSLCFLWCGPVLPADQTTLAVFQRTRLGLRMGGGTVCLALGCRRRVWEEPARLRGCRAFGHTHHVGRAYAHISSAAGAAPSFSMDDQCTRIQRNGGSTVTPSGIAS